MQSQQNNHRDKAVANMLLISPHKVTNEAILQDACIVLPKTVFRHPTQVSLSIFNLHKVSFHIFQPTRSVVLYFQPTQSVVLYFQPTHNLVLYPCEGRMWVSMVRTNSG